MSYYTRCYSFNNSYTMYNEALIVTFSYIISTLLNQSSKLNITWSAIVRFYTLN
jgi:hypothetical protein